MDAFLKTGKFSSKDKDSSRQPKKPGESSKKRLLPWVEKYRPKKIEDVASQEEVVEVLKKSLEGADLPNLLFYGPPGTGKTSTILAAARELFGDLYHQRVLELNASDERGIQVIREKVKNFSQLSASGVREDGRRCPPFKIVILDEADSMTGAAQAALRRTMESQTKSTRFCLVCNYVSRIIEPLTSRCSKFRFKPLSRDVLINRLRYICDSESLKCDTDALLTLVDTCEGDLRRAITSLQCLSALHPHGTAEDEQGAIVSDDVYDITGTIPLDVLDDLVSACMKGTYDQCEMQVASFLQKGFSAYQFVLQLQERLVEGADFSDKQKSVLAEKLAVCDQRLIDGADEYLQLMDVCCALMEARNI